MQPARQDLPVVPGTTYRDTVRLMQPDYAYKLITQISGAPAVLSVPLHGLAGDWPVWVRGVAGLPAINREPPNALPHRAKRLDENTLEVNAVSAEGARPEGGQLIYRLPVDIAAAEVRGNVAQPEALAADCVEALRADGAQAILDDLVHP